MSSSKVLQCLEVRKGFNRAGNRIEILKGIDLEINSGESVAIMGPSGAGKSSLLQILGGMSVPDSGTLKILGTNTSELNDKSLSTIRRQKLGFVFQGFNLLPTLSAVENVAWPLLLDGKDYQSSVERALKLLSQVGLSERKSHFPRELSGGEQQRVAIARALVANPEIVLADEPTGALDSKSGKLVLELLHSLRVIGSCSLIIVTHDQNVAKGCDRLIELIDGRIKT